MLPRIAELQRAQLRDETEVEDAMQQAYVDAYHHLAGAIGWWRRC